MQSSQLKRREFIGLLGGASVAWPHTARGQQTDRMRRVGALMNMSADDAEAPVRLAAFLQGLQERGWTVGRNLRTDTRWGAGRIDLYRRYAVELVALAPDVILATATPAVAALQQESRTVPIVFASSIDPVGAGLVASLARPGGNATGFILFEYGISVKWLELLKQIAPGITRVAVIRDPSAPGGSGQLGAIQGAAPGVGVELTPIDARDANEIERGIAVFAQAPNGGVVSTASALTTLHRDLIIANVARYALPAIYSDRIFVAAGGLISYGPNRFDQYRLAADYVDRILKGKKPSDLPVQAPTKYELVINLKTAKALGLDVPATVLARADEVLE
jgi:putative ABC transport system substrate-binding protein